MLVFVVFLHNGDNFERLGSIEALRIDAVVISVFFILRFARGLCKIPSVEFSRNILLVTHHTLVETLCVQELRNFLGGLP